MPPCVAELEEVISAPIARHVAHLFTRDPLVAFEGAVAEVEAGSTVMHALEDLVKNTSRTSGLDGENVSVSFEQDGSLLLRRSIARFGTAAWPRPP